MRLKISLPAYSLVIAILLLSHLVRAQSAATGISYFQQHVQYTLDARFLDDYANPSIEGNGSLDYTNSSPDTLHEMYFHLYWNLFRHGSYGESAPNRDHSPDSKYGHGGIDIERMSVTYPQDPRTQSESNPKYEIDNTILRLFLSKPLPPGESLHIEFGWHGLLPNYGIRSTWGWHDNSARNFSTAQWYPQVCVYDNHGWHPDQYIGMGEFYTDYGSFDVTLHLPERFTTVSTTGWLTNASETLPDSVRTQLDFAKAHPDSIVRIADYSGFHFTPVTKDEPIRTWRFHADSVRDFAWCADEAYIWDAV
ncbi:MAG TPA: hypothetical protein VG537_06410, partial [Candidatus Kapabacteria bacterium]|nr:hypothetical protein [Candidatus Kapabacteria bacterium]